MTKPADYDHLMANAARLFPGSKIELSYEYETIYLDVDGHRFTFEIGSDDDAYVFDDGKTSFEIPLMENLDEPWDFS